MMKFPATAVQNALRRTGVAIAATLLLFFGFLFVRAMFVSTLAEAATNTYHPGFCLGGWESPEAAAGKPGQSAANGGPGAAYLAPDVFAQIFCGYFSVTPREKAPKTATVTFNFSLSGEAVDPETPVEESIEEEGEEAEEEVVEEESTEETQEEETPEEEVTEETEETPVEEEVVEEEEAPAEETPQEEPSESEETSFFDLFAKVAKAEEPEENFLETFGEELVEAEKMLGDKKRAKRK